MTNPSQIQKKLQKLQNKWQEQHPITLTKITLHRQSAKIILRGYVLTMGQYRALEKIVSTFPKVENKVTVLARLGKKRILSLRCSPSPLLDRPGGRLMSEALEEEGGVSLLWPRPVQSHYLVCLPDGTVGWMEAESLSFDSPSSFLPWEYPISGRVWGASLEKMEEFFSTLETYLGTPYLLGGRTRKGLDCSALVQAVFRDVFGVMLPRNSRDQRRLGIRVGFSSRRAADLVFGIGREKPYSHVGICLPGGEILHASLKKGKVVREKWEEWCCDYRPVCVRRIVSYGTPFSF